MKFQTESFEYETKDKRQKQIYHRDTESTELKDSKQNSIIPITRFI